MSDTATTQPIELGPCYLTDERAVGLHKSGKAVFPVSLRGMEILASEKSRLDRRLANGELYR